MYEITELLDDRNRDLYASIIQKIPVVLKDSDDEAWGALIPDGEAIISRSQSTYPISCFTHELLHVEENLAGRALPEAFYSSHAQEGSEEQERVIQYLLPFAYNLLIHHRTFKRFVSLGFPPHEFLHVESIDDRRRVEGDVAKIKAQKKRYPHGVPFSNLVYPFFWASSPEDSSSESADLRRQIRILREAARSTKPPKCWLFFATTGHPMFAGT